ncbi:MinD/ParA family ATP-binding protein [Rivihabitans pingtungensis]|jgi:flagellar biosynthesis protein FlhG|uniref:Flagellar biosynthesis protein FlhG n=1 Tax=Rivihabitans pingtungensis TaxID=1054498 RepID=A0A318L4G5_9NEIS|nr:cellulose synthase operon protein YhjQ/BcsQ [Rivihabitans pingtungensis]MCK6437229.1 flagellar synthesis regulator FleN [Rivihabitans pingtungensis]PXX80363.1 flagellar biosynthesis protein FlhG [Rivihabitans pingtungensis]HNX69731.1 cellulose synthase operon protein YhjQ/BcsQ [Rivihabitans pingtungensis]
MEDQAASLRRLTPAAQVGRSFAFLGVSGCGVTTMVSEMAAGLTAAQRRTLIIDAHPGNPLAQRFVDDPGVTLDMVASSQGSLHDAVTQLPFGASVMNVHSRPSTLMHLPEPIEHRLVSEYEALTRDIELVLIDAPSVSTDPALAALADNLVLVLTPDIQTLMQAYAMVKRLALEFARRRFDVLVNRARDMNEAQAIFQRLSQVTSEFLGVSLRWVGFVPEDPMVRRAVLLRTTTLHGFPGSEAGTACSQLAAVLPRWSSVEHGNARQLFERYLAATRHLAEEAATPL